MNTILFILFFIVLIAAILIASYLLLFKRQMYGVISETGISVNPHLISLIKIVLISSYIVIFLSLLALIKTTLALSGYEMTFRTLVGI